MDEVKLVRIIELEKRLAEIDAVIQFLDRIRWSITETLGYLRGGE